MSINLTPVRLAVLRLLQQQPRFDQHHLAAELYSRGHIRWKEYYIHDVDRPKYMNGPTGQASARWSGGFIKPLLEAGLIKRSWLSTSRYSDEYRRDYLFITDKGRDALHNELE